MRTAALQFDVRRSEVAANLARVERGLREAAERGVELALLPELWPTSFCAAAADRDAAVDATEPAWTRIAELSRELRIAVAGSGYTRAAARELPRNRLRLVVDGEVALE